MTEYLGETKKQKKKRKQKNFREEEERPRDEEQLDVELQETNGVESPRQKPGKPSTGIICSEHFNQIFTQTY